MPVPDWDKLKHLNKTVVVVVVVVIIMSTFLTTSVLFHFLYFMKAVGKLPKRRWEDNIRMDLREIDCGCVDWIHLALDRDQ
jgi:hypothetical protein